MTTATSKLAALLAEHNAQMFEMPEAEGFLFWSARIHGRITLVFPTGQDARQRLQYAVEQIERLAHDEVERIAASLGAVIVEVDPALKPASLANVETHGWYQSEPTPHLVFPAGQKPGERLAAARQIQQSLVGT